MFTNKSELIKGLRGLADYLDANDFPQDACRYEIGMSRVWCDTPESFIQAAKAMGSFVKSVSDSFFDVKKIFDGGIELEATINRDKICKKVKKMQEVEVWECPESILAPEEKQEEVNAG